MTENEKVTLIETEQRSKSNTKRIDKLEDQNAAIYQIATNVEVMAVEMKQMVSQISEIKCDIGGMKDGINQDIGSIKQDVNNLGTKVNQVVVEVDKKLDNMKTEIIKVDIKDSHQKAAKWDDLKGKLIWAGISGIAVWIVSQFVTNVLMK